MTEGSLDPMIESVWLCLFLVHLVLSITWTLELIKYIDVGLWKGADQDVSALSFPHSPV